MILGLWYDEDDDERKKLWLSGICRQREGERER